MRRTREVRTGGSAEAAWAALGGPAWSGPIRFEVAGDAGYAGAARLVDADADECVAGGHAQARRTTGWGGVAASFAARPAAGAIQLDADVRLTGDAPPAAGDALLDAVVAWLEEAARAGAGTAGAPGGPAADAAPAAAPAAGSPADDPAWRRRLAARAALAVAIGAAAGVVGSRIGRRR